jgi:hypothetical protein
MDEQEVVKRLQGIGDIMYPYSEKSGVITDDMNVEDALTIIEEHAQNLTDQIEEFPEEVVTDEPRVDYNDLD